MTPDGPSAATGEAEFLDALRRLPLHPGARGLADDAAVLDVAPLVVTTDTLVEHVHFLSDDPPEDIAWKLMAVNLSDLAAKGAVPEGVMLSYPLSVRDWDMRFLRGLGVAIGRWDAPLVGGDTVSLPAGAPRVLTLVAFGRDAVAPVRSGARAGDTLWVTGTIGDAGEGLRIARGEAPHDAGLVARYCRPMPRLGEGRALGPVVNAMSDVSDGLLIDARRMAAASGLSVAIDLADVPLSPALRARCGDGPDARLAAASAGDDYELLFALPPGVVPPVAATRVGGFDAGAGLVLAHAGVPVAAPVRLGYEHAR